MASELSERIRQATLRALTKRDLYADRTTALITKSLGDAESEVSKAILRFKSLGSLPDNKLAALKGLEKLQAEIDEITKRVKAEHTLAFKKGTKEAFRLGIGQGIGELAQAALPFYDDLKPEGIDKLSTKVFTIVDTDALDFMTQYNLTLAGDVHRELRDGIKRTILSGITTGKSSDDIVRDLGRVIVDKDSFRQAGTKVFSKAQYRMEMIARTEVLRAHNMGRLKFHERVGVQKLEWLAIGDERMCPICGGLDGKQFPIDKFPQQPAHPMCRCTNTVTHPVAICGSTLSAKAAPQEPLADSCILPPHLLEAMADAQAQENAKLKKAFEQGDATDLSSLTVKQLQTLSKQNGISVARTKADFIKLLDAAEPGVDHADLAGAALTSKLKQYQIGLLRTKEELLALLSQKQAQLKEAKQQATALSKLPPAEDLNDMTTQKLKELAKENGISLNMTKDETIKLLDSLEPGVDHKGLKGQELSAVKQKYGIGILKNKEQLVSALQKKAGADMAEAAKKKALDEAGQKLIAKQKSDLESAMQKVVMPQSPMDYKTFVGSVSEAEQAISAGSDLPQELLAAQAKELALKKQLFKEQIEKLKAGDLKELAKNTKLKYWQWANKDELTVLFTETDPAKIEAVQKSIDAKHAAWSEKHGGGKKKPLAEQSPKPPQKPAEKPISPPTPPKKKGAEFEEVDKAWQEKGLPSRFSLIGKAEVGGAHEKEFWVDEAGNRWLFKPQKGGKDEVAAFAEEAGYKIGRLMDPKAIEVRTIRLKGRLGSIQQWRVDLKADFDFRSVDPQNLTTTEVEHLQREHVLDWLIANHDGHSKQFLRANSGVVLGIDKGQAFKFLGKDKLSVDYAPNSACGEEEPYYNKLFRSARQGKVKFDPAVTHQYIQQVERIGDEEYLEILKPYAQARFGEDELGRKHFLEQALSRKHNLRKDFESYYGEILGKKSFRFDSVNEIQQKGKLGQAERAIVEQARMLGWQGKTLPMDGEQIEDQNALVFGERFKDDKRTVIKMKIRPDAEKQFLKAVKFGLEPEEQKPEPLKEDTFFGDILTSIKHVSHHADKGNYEQNKIQIGTKHREELKKLLSSDDAAVQAMAKSYLHWINEIESAHKEHRKVFGNFEQYLRSPELKKAKKDKPAYNTKCEPVRNTLRQLKKGEIIVSEDNASNSTMFKGHSMPAGKQYTVVFEDGTRIRYRPFEKQNLYAQSGELEVVHAGDVSAEHIEAMLEKLQALGLDTSVATQENAEYMYLQKLAYIRKTDTTNEYQQTIKALDNREASTSERVTALREYWQKNLGVPDITKLSGYNPQGEYQSGFMDRKVEGGYRHQYRFDVSDEDLEKEMKGYVLSHHLSNGEKIPGFIETVLENNGAMVSTVEKMRIGIPPGGMSPEQDMRTGGATYFFTRIKKMPSGEPDTGLYFKKKMLRRMDAVSYSHDAYGKVIDNYVHDHRGSTIDKWKEFTHNNNNETIFKYSVTIVDNIECIIVDDETERKSVIGSFIKRGIDKLPDGRNIQDVVLTPKGWKTKNGS